MHEETEMVDSSEHTYGINPPEKNVFVMCSVNVCKLQNEKPIKVGAVFHRLLTMGGKNANCGKRLRVCLQIDENLCFCDKCLPVQLLSVAGKM